MWGRCFLVGAVVAASCVAAGGDPISARHPQGPTHGFLLLKSAEGKVLAVGDQVTTVAGDELHSRLTFRFRDGSLDDEMTVFRQRRTFELISDHHVQKGPSYPQPMDMTINVPKGQVTWSESKDGKTEVKTESMNLPPDLANGMITAAVENFPADADELKVSYVAGDPKPRIIKLSIKRDGEDPFDVGGIRHRAIRYNIHPELGGVAAVIAPVIGKQPSDIQVWLVGGETPAFLKMVGALYDKGPIWTIVEASAVWPRDLSNRR